MLSENFIFRFHFHYILLIILILNFLSVYVHTGLCLNAWAKIWKDIQQNAQCVNSIHLWWHKIIFNNFSLMALLFTVLVCEYATMIISFIIFSFLPRCTCSCLRVHACPSQPGLAWALVQMWPCSCPPPQTA